MKKFTSLSVILLCTSISTYAAEYEFIAGDSSIETKTCIAAVTNDTEAMISNLKMLGRRGTSLSYRSFVNSFWCNDQYIGNFAKTYHAENSLAYLDKYTNKWNKKRQSNITIKDLASKPTSEEDTIVVLVSSR
ncbi:hypothetical protein [Aliiglaciecola litoralis]|uniref:DUF3718 domain-containing protein n=1 Tax=Aliiglaciecola litoralis TaxID=582857 RepID=A0ABP3WYG3_9ALTE